MTKYFANSILLNKKNYITITPFFPSEKSFRGSFIFDQVIAIKKNSNFNVIVLKPKSIFSDKSSYNYKGVDVFYFNSLSLPSNLFPGLFKLINRFFLSRKIKGLNLDIDLIEVVHIHSFNNSQYAKVFKSWRDRIKTIQQYHGLDVLGLKQGRLSRFNIQKKWINRFAENIFEDIDLHVCVSNKVLENLKNYEFFDSNGYILYNGVDLNKFYPQKKKEGFKKFTIGCIANFIPLKDQMTLLKAIKMIIENGGRDIDLKFVGDGPTKNRCIRYVMENKLGDYVSFISSIQHEDLVNFYNSLNLFVMPSYYEALGCVYLEAYSCGTPFIGVKDQGIEELIKKEQRQKWLIEKGDFIKLAYLINDAKTDGSLDLNQSIDIDQLIKIFLTKIKEIQIN